MHQRIKRISAFASGLGLGVMLTVGTWAAAPTTSVAVPTEDITFEAAPTPQQWDPLTDSKWAFEGEEIILTARGINPGPPRRPFEYAVVTAGPELASVDIRAEVRIDEPVEFSNRDVIIVWNYQSPTRFYYAHLSSDNTIYPHNGIFVVNDADRLRIDDQWWANQELGLNLGAPPAITDTAWHDVRVKYDADTGAIGVYVDGATEPLMTATDTTFSGGRVGFGSFDNYGRTRHYLVTGARS